MPHRDHPARLDATLRRLARFQLGLVTVGQIAAAGIDHSAVTRRRASGALDEVFAGVLRLGAVPTTPEQRTLAAALAVPGSVVAASSAALVCGLPVGSPSAPIVTVGRSRSARTAGIAVVRSQLVLPSRPWYSVRAATPEAVLVLLPRSRPRPWSRSVSITASLTGSPRSAACATSSSRCRVAPSSAVRCC
ncbi:MAG: type IV toxin-antitoxin system AbiEi family antitoxin domain-containing protein [Acidimicrobiales bacterium]|nr:type IV toxin-antitoxin system AbiEi family antitoxin domain-containing protein [Acidimicrobiales bacterium]